MTKVLHVSDMFWGACGDSLIVKYDKAVHEVMDGRYSVLPFEVKDQDGENILIYGFYYICDGGYPKFNSNLNTEYLRVERLLDFFSK
jgi:hypothetical protein